MKRSIAHKTVKSGKCRDRKRARKNAAALTIAAWRLARLARGLKQAKQRYRRTAERKKGSGSRGVSHALSVGSIAVGSFALGASAFGALAVGAVAIKRLAIKRAAIGRLDLGKVKVGRLEVDELIVNESRRTAGLASTD
jgi:hypothetical protein